MNQNTHIHSDNSTQRMMQHYLIALLPLLLFGFFKNGILPFLKDQGGIYDLFLPVIILVVALLASFITEISYFYIQSKIKKEPFEFQTLLHRSHFYIPGLIFALILPLHTPLYLVFLGSVGASFLGKLVFGGIGKNIWNPALVGKALIFLLFGHMVLGQGGYLNLLEKTNGITTTPLTNLFQIDGIGTYQTLIVPFGRMLDFIIGTIPGEIGTTSSILCVIGFIYLSWNKVIKWKIPVFYVGTVFLITSMIGAYHGLGLWYPLFQVMIGGVLFGAIYMATDPVTTPATPIGQVLFGIFLGILTIFFRYVIPMELGVLLSILIMNSFVILLDHIGSRARFQFQMALVPFCLAWTLILLLGMYIGTTYPKTEIKNNTPVEEKKVVVKDNFRVLTTLETPPYVTYDVTNNTTNGAYVLRYTTLDHLIHSIQIISYSDSLKDYEAIITSNYLGQLILNQANLQEQQEIENVELSKSIKSTTDTFYNKLQGR